MRDYPNMSYCMYENTALALNQILGDLNDALEADVTFDQYREDRSSREERDAILELEGLLEEVQYMLKQLRDNPAHN
jgi:hypothetical protein